VAVPRHTHDTLAAAERVRALKIEAFRAFFMRSNAAEVDKPPEGSALVFAQGTIDHADERGPP
jgi:hypothetical protein